MSGHDHITTTWRVIQSDDSPDVPLLMVYRNGQPIEGWEPFSDAPADIRLWLDIIGESAK